VVPTGEVEARLLLKAAAAERRLMHALIAERGKLVKAPRGRAAA
jgi:hypothetical protein